MRKTMTEGRSEEWRNSVRGFPGFKSSCIMVVVVPGSDATLYGSLDIPHKHRRRYL
jgi:hypothetical protein